jgi:hypothetical protein
MSCNPASGILDPDCNNNPQKFFASMNLPGAAKPFVVYGSAKCGLPGARADLDGEERATAMLLAREEAQAEAVTWSILDDTAVDINPAGALSPASALAALEGWLGSTYGSLGAIHAPRRAASLFSTNGAISPSGSHLLTKLGTPVSAGGGYPGTGPLGAAPAAGTQWVFAAPALFGYRGTVFATSAVDTGNNNFYALAERQYVIGFDPCGVGAVRVTV